MLCQAKQKPVKLYKLQWIEQDLVALEKEEEENFWMWSVRLRLMSHIEPETYLFAIVSIHSFEGSRPTKKFLHFLVDHFSSYTCFSTSKIQILLTP